MRSRRVRLIASGVSMAPMNLYNGLNVCPNISRRLRSCRYEKAKGRMADPCEDAGSRGEAWRRMPVDRIQESANADAVALREGSRMDSPRAERQARTVVHVLFWQDAPDNWGDARAGRVTRREVSLSQVQEHADQADVAMQTRAPMASKAASR